MRQANAVAALAMFAALALFVAACGSGSAPTGQGAGGQAPANAKPSGVRLSITPATGSKDRKPNRGITVTAAGGRISRVVVRTRGDRVTGRLNAAGTAWRSDWALNVSRRYAVTATGVGPSGQRVTQTSSFRTFTPRNTFSTRIVEGFHQTYGVGMPIVLYFGRPIREQGGGGAGARRPDLEAGRGRLVLGRQLRDGSDLPVLPPAALLEAAHAGDGSRRTSTASRAPRGCSGTTPSRRASGSARRWSPWSAPRSTS